MSDDPRTIIPETSKKDFKGEEKDGGSSSNTVDIEEGYQTPTSEEHRIPPVDLSRPPPAPGPRKRKRVVFHRRKAPNTAVAVDESTVKRIEEELELFFKFCAMQPRVQPEPGPITGPKKRRTDHDR